MEKAITFNTVRARLASEGVTIKANEFNEYEVKARGARDASTYFADRGHTREDQRAALADALATGLEMARRAATQIRKAG